MRTTLTLDPDVAAGLCKLQKLRNESWKQIVNEALRRGIRELESTGRNVHTSRTASYDLGRVLTGDILRIGEIPAAEDVADGRLDPPTRNY
ncbi:MAG: hypothetical protein HY286_07870 [Planctomycetes bacterium]|nr:hypothetical protein [Planctomycetota bacterium]